MKVLNVAVLGLGTVGTGVVNIVEENKKQIEDTIGKSIHIKHILVNSVSKKRAINTSSYHLTDNIDDILNDDELDIVVEVMGGIEPTVEWLKLFLSKGIHVITANKDLLAVHLRVLEDLAEKNKVALKYEASVAGGIPIVNAINNGLNANNINQFMGIFNGTSNFILSQMTREGKSYEEALQLATDLGYAEADPTDDVEGVDAARKVVITSYLSFNRVISLNDVERVGISDVEIEDIKVAERLGYKIKLIGQGKYANGKVLASVKPTLLPNSHQMAHVEDEYNAIYVIGDAVGDTMFYGKGAGSLATGSAVVSDLLNVALQFESDLHTLPPHFELKTEQTKEIVEEEVVKFPLKSSHFIIVENDKEEDELRDEIKKAIEFHRSVKVEQRTENTYGVVIRGIDELPIETLRENGINIVKYYPIEGDK
ncbi:homoserine dehydrogenase [Mammaliicoccus fleurettii]|uniref:homoserine dehydrogenase n=1 Tax=Mammaliicoccus fleurettii TaxID=150056 RepID=UPI002DBC913F|nr:homoserine dehydrogenase [Mammaliicoccus fleurettii]MEB7780158.1 homoserine dehydrogenase [Mammaliicoccus fleurettii]